MRGWRRGSSPPASPTRPRTCDGSWSPSSSSSRSLDLKKLPSVSETIDWARVLVLLHAAQLDHAMVRDTLNVLLKFESDIEAVQPQIADLLLKARREAVPVR
ncbi:hypothetical protein [Dankookia sp. P2]|uniref:hypothetical protein n=1 Tax=Dankookia sp. P2 TaxID=3423955 RepID=UPI003D664F3A